MLSVYIGVLSYLVVGEGEPELLDTGLDGVPAGEAVSGGCVTDEEREISSAGLDAYPMETYRVRPKSSGLRISYVLGLLRMALAWIPALWVNAQYPLQIEAR